MFQNVQSIKKKKKGLNFLIARKDGSNDEDKRDRDEQNWDPQEEIHLIKIDYFHPEALYVVNFCLFWALQANWI